VTYKSAGRGVPRTHIAYLHSNNLTKRHLAEVLAKKVQKRTASDFGSEREIRHCWTVMKAKTSMDMKPKKKTMKKKMTKKRILSTTKQGSALPFLSMFSVFESLSSEAASLVKAVNDSKAARRQLEELQRHDRAMEQIRGLYLAPYKYGRGLYLGSYKRRQYVAKKKNRQRDDKNAV